MAQRKKLKMKELSEATGVSSGTIRYYIQEGLLPQPEKTSKNMAYYDESYIDRILMIKKLQKTRHLPLDIIKTIMDGLDDTVEEDRKNLLTELEKPFYPNNGNELSQLMPMTKAELIAHTELKEEDVDKMQSMEMIQQDENGTFDLESVRLAEIVAELRRVGLDENFDFHVEHLQLHMDLVEFMVRKEVELFTKRMIKQGIDSEKMNKMIRDSIHTINKLINVLHFRMVRKITEEIS